MYINTFKYKPEDVSCVLCTEYVKKLGCTALSCPCLAERMEAGTVGYPALLFRVIWSGKMKTSIVPRTGYTVQRSTIS